MSLIANVAGGLLAVKCWKVRGPSTLARELAQEKIGEMANKPPRAEFGHFAK